MQESIAIISDIHANSLALEAVLADISSRDIQMVVNLGDSLFGPIDLLGTAKLLMEAKNMIHIMGNCDELLLKQELSSATFNFVKPLLDKEIEDWLRSCKETWVYEELLFCHGTPDDNDQHLLELISEHDVRYKDWEIRSKLTSGIKYVNSRKNQHQHMPKKAVKRGCILTADSLCTKLKT